MEQAPGAIKIVTKCSLHMYTFNYCLELFLIYNQRRVNREWKDEKEAAFLKGHEELHTHLAAERLPDGFLNEVVDTVSHKVRIHPSLLSPLFNRTTLQ